MLLHLRKIYSSSHLLWFYSFVIILCEYYWIFNIKSTNLFEFKIITTKYKFQNLNFYIPYTLIYFWNIFLLLNLLGLYLFLIVFEYWINLKSFTSDLTKLIKIKSTSNNLFWIKIITSTCSFEIILIFMDSWIPYMLLHIRKMDLFSNLNWIYLFQIN